MIVKTEKITPSEIIENACPECDGSGKKMVVPYGEPPFEIECGYCLGEKIITEDLQIRKNAGKALRTLLTEHRLLIRAAAEKFSQSFREWVEAVQGKASADAIKAKIVLIETEFSVKPRQRTRSNCPFTRLRGFPS